MGMLQPGMTPEPPEAPQDEPQDPEDLLPRMSLPDHLNELRSRLMKAGIAVVVGMVISFVFHKEVWAFVSKPYVEASSKVGVAQEDAKLTAIDVGEGFLQILKLCFLAGILLASPIVLWQMWGFVAAGLYDHERRVVRIFFPVSVMLFALGMIAAFILLIPFGMRFLIGFNVEANFGSQFRIQSYLSMCITAVFGMGFLFQLPLVMLFAMATDLVSRATLWRGWRYAVVLSFIAGMFLPHVGQLASVVSVVSGFMLALAIAWWTELVWLLGLTQAATLEVAQEVVSRPSSFLVNPVAALFTFVLAAVLGALLAGPDAERVRPLTWRGVVFGERRAASRAAEAEPGPSDR